MRRAERVIQGLIIFSAFLGAVFLWEAHPLLPTMVFGFIFVGWALFVVDSFLTFVKPVPSFYLGLVLAVLALTASLPQPVHYTFFSDGQYLAAATFVLGSATQVALILLVAYYAISSRRGISGPSR